MEKRELRTIGEFPYGLHTYEVLFDPVDKVWFVRRMDEKRLRAVFEGDIEVDWVRDALVRRDFIIVKANDEVIYGHNVGTVITLFRRVVPGIHSHYFIDPLLRTLISQTKKRDGYLFSGFYADGFAEGYLPYPAASWDCEPRSLEAMAKQITEAFPSINRANALVNVALAIAKVFSPGIRFAVDRVFEDRIVINTPDLYPSLRSLFLSIVDLLGLDQDEVYNDNVWDRPIISTKALMELLMSSTAPLFLDEVGDRGLGVVVQFGPEVAFTNTPIGSESLKRCPGCVIYYYNLRSVMVNTVLDHSEVERLLRRHYRTREELEWALRRLLIIRWDHAPARRGVEFSDKPILGCLRELWGDQGFRNRVLSSAWGIEDLAVMVMEAFRTRYGVDTSPYTEALRVLAERQEGSEGEVVRRRRPEDLVVSRMYEIARQVLGVTNISVYQVLKAVVEDPGKFDVKVTGSKWKYMVERDMKEWEGLVRELGLAPEGLAVQPSDPRFEALGDVEKALALVWWLISTGRNRLIIYAGSASGVFSGWSRELFGSRLGRYGSRRGYSVSWVVLLRYMLNVASVSTGKGGNEGSAVGTEKP